MDEYKITAAEVSANNVKAAADLVKGEPEDNKNIFDRLPELIVTKFNGFITAVVSKFTEYYNKTEIDGKVSDLNTAIDLKANSADVYEKDSVYTKEETDSAINRKVTEIGTGDMAKEVYDANGDGIVDNAAMLSGQLPSYYATKAEAEAAQTAVNTHIANTSNPHSVTKSQVGLGNVTNNKQMPIAGGTFAGNAVAYETARTTRGLFNEETRSGSTTGTLQSVQYFINVTD